MGINKHIVGKSYLSQIHKKMQFTVYTVASKRVPVYFQFWITPTLYLLHVPIHKAGLITRKLLLAF